MKIKDDKVKAETYAADDYIPYLRIGNIQNRNTAQFRYPYVPTMWTVAPEGYNKDSIEKQIVSTLLTREEIAFLEQ